MFDFTQARKQNKIDRKAKHFLTCSVVQSFFRQKNALCDDNVNALTSLAPSYITRHSVIQSATSCKHAKAKTNLHVIFSITFILCVFGKEI